MKKLTPLISLLLLGTTANAMADFAGVIVCNKIKEPIVITCNNHAAPPIFSGGCLPASWKAMATNPLLFGGKPRAPIMHFVCQWTAKRTGDQIMSTVMDVFDDGSRTYTLGKVSNVIVSDNYIAMTHPNPLPADYTSSISVEVKKK